MLEQNGLLRTKFRCGALIRLGAPIDTIDGSAWLEGGQCSQRVTRGGAWNSDPYDYVRSANRAGIPAGEDL